MKTVQKIIAALLAAVCLFSITACVRDGVSDTDVKDGEDVTVTYGKVTIANMSGKDAVKLFYKLSTATEWSDNILSQDYFHNGMGLQLTYPIGTKSKFDIRLVFEDGSYRDFTKLDIEDYADKGQIIYLGEAPKNATEKTTVK